VQLEEANPIIEGRKAIAASGPLAAYRALTKPEFPLSLFIAYLQRTTPPGLSDSDAAFLSHALDDD
jgi:hypothetical protein